MEVLKIDSAGTCSLTNLVQFPFSLMLVSSTARIGIGRVADSDLSTRRKNETEKIYKSFFIQSRKQNKLRSRSSAASVYDSLQGRTKDLSPAACDPSRRCELHDLHGELVPYTAAWQWQKDAVANRSDALTKGHAFDDTLLLLQHPPVYTLGTRSSLQHLKFDIENPPAEIHRTERGGEVTYHGPGQLVMYPIIDLRKQQQDLHWYLRSLEEVIIRTLWTASGIKAERVQGLTGVWAENCKLAAIGVRVSRWIAYHGVALNVTTDMEPYDHIVPCGLSLPVANVKNMIFNQQGGLACVQGSKGGVLANPQRYGLPEGFVKLSKFCSDESMLTILSEHLLAHFSEIFDLTFVNPTTVGPYCNDRSFRVR